MLEVAELVEIWRDSGLTPPNRKLAIHDNVWYYVLEDDRSIVFLLSTQPIETVSRRGKKASKKYKVFTAGKSKCFKATSEIGRYYEIEEGALTVVSCNKIFSERQKILQDALKSNE